jgi:hypothetical protein
MAGPTDESRRANDIREIVKHLPVVALDESFMKETLVYTDEDSFWVQMCNTKLNPRSDTINNIKGLKDKLKDLKYTALLILVMVNALWMGLMIMLSTVCWWCMGKSS